jgi:hypothetical protein
MHFPLDYNYLSDNLNKSIDDNKQTVNLFAEFGEQSGYFLLEVDTTEDKMRILRYVSNREIEEHLNNYFLKSREGFHVANYKIKDLNKFEIEVFFTSDTAQTLHHEVLKVQFDQTTQEFIFKKASSQ